MKMNVDRVLVVEVALHCLVVRAGLSVVQRGKIRPPHLKMCVGWGKGCCKGWAECEEEKAAGVIVRARE